VIALSVLNLPVLIVRYNQGLFHMLLLDAPILTFSTASVALFYATGQRYLYPDSWRRRLVYLPLVMALGIGLSFSNAKAVFEALARKKSSFVRTPKYRIESASDTSWLRKRYKRSRGFLPALELSFAAYFGALIAYAASMGMYGAIPFLTLFGAGFVYTGALSLFGGLGRSRTA
jgi:hypothetical protein